MKKLFVAMAMCMTLVSTAHADHPTGVVHAEDSTIWERINEELSYFGLTMESQEWLDFRSDVRENAFIRLDQQKNSGDTVWVLPNGTVLENFDELMSHNAAVVRGDIIGGGLYNKVNGSGENIGWEIWVETSSKGWIQVTDVSFADFDTRLDATAKILQDTFDEVFEMGFKEGYDQGFVDGYEQGYADGYFDGFEDGYAVGSAD